MVAVNIIHFSNTVSPPEEAMKACRPDVISAKHRGEERQFEQMWEERNYPVSGSYVVANAFHLSAPKDSVPVVIPSQHASGQDDTIDAKSVVILHRPP